MLGKLRVGVLLFVGASAAAQDAVDLSVLRGRVLDPHGLGVDGATVEVLRCPGDEFACLDPDYRREFRSIGKRPTRNDGTFAIHVPPNLAIRLVVDKAPYAIEQRRRLYGGDVVTVQLRKATALTIESRGPGGTSAPARVRGWNTKTLLEAFDTRTDPQGNLHVPRLTPGSIVVSVEPRNTWIPRWQSIHMFPGGSGRLQFRSERGGTLSGTVRDAKTGKPIRNAEVGLGRSLHLRTKSDANGHYAIRGLGGPVVHPIHARARGYATAQIVAPSGKDGRARHDFALMKGAVARGRILDGSDRPVRDCYVAAIGKRHDGPTDEVDWIPTRTGRDGRFRIDNLRRERLDYVLMVRHDSFATLLYNFPYIDEESHPVFEDIVMRPRRVLRGTLKKQNGDPIRGVGVALIGCNEDRWTSAGHETTFQDLVLYATRRMGWTNSRGQFVFGDLPAGEYSIVQERQVLAQRIVVPEDGDPKPLALVK